MVDKMMSLIIFLENSYDFCLETIFKQPLCLYCVLCSGAGGKA